MTSRNPLEHDGEPRRWEAITEHSLSAASLRLLMDNSVAAVRIPGLVSEDMCARTADVVRTQHMCDYPHVDPPVGRVGLTQVEYADRPDAYFDKVAEAEQRRQRLFDGLVDPVSVVLNQLRGVWDDVAIATDGLGREYYAGVVHRFGGELPKHSDWAPREAADWTVGNVTAQLSWNIYYELPESGGETLIWDRQWTREVQHCDGFGYPDEVVAGRSCCTVRPRRGELVLFSPRNVHEVTAPAGNAPRIAVFSFIGLDPESRLVLWS